MRCCRADTVMATGAVLMLVHLLMLASASVVVAVDAAAITDLAQSDTLLLTYCLLTTNYPQTASQQPASARANASLRRACRRAEYCDEGVCLSVSLSARIFPKLHVKTSPNFLCMLPTAVARSSGGVAMRYIM